MKIINEYLELTDSDGINGSVLKLNKFWLRDHCRCTVCYNPTYCQRTINILNIPEDIEVVNYVVNENLLNISCKF